MKGTGKVSHECGKTTVAGKQEKTRNENFKIYN
jgi:hypothetical protein